MSDPTPAPIPPEPVPNPEALEGAPDTSTVTATEAAIKPGGTLSFNAIFEGAFTIQAHNNIARKLFIERMARVEVLPNTIDVEGLYRHCLLIAKEVVRVEKIEAQAAADAALEAAKFGTSPDV